MATIEIPLVYYEHMPSSEADESMRKISQKTMRKLADWCRNMLIIYGGERKKPFKVNDKDISLFFQADLHE